MYKLTTQQEAIVNKIASDINKPIAVNAVSGAGKTSLLTAIVERLQPTSALYLAYNNAIAAEAQHKFPKSTICKTTHALAYANVVRTKGLRVRSFTYRSIKEKVSYEDKLLVANHLNSFCLSKFTCVDDYADEHCLSSTVRTLLAKYLELMATNLIEVSHAFYLKYYHMLLATEAIVHKEFDLLMLDEAGDLNPVTLQIFRLLPAKKKIMVGDENQNIYSFNDTINGFKIMQNASIPMVMTKSFRVSNKIATFVEAFARHYMNPDFEFTGVDYTDTTINTEAYIARTNSALIGEMITLNQNNISYNLTRPADQIFKLPLTLMNLKPGKFVSPEYKYLQDSADIYYDPKKGQNDAYKSLFAYLQAVHPDDVNLKSAISLISKYGSSTIVEAYNHAKSHAHKNHYLTLCTAHSSKGLEFDHVKIVDDLNYVVKKCASIPKNERTNAEQEEFRLYYVAVTRAKKSISNASHLHLY